MSPEEGTEKVSSSMPAGALEIDKKEKGLDNGSGRQAERRQLTLTIISYRIQWSAATSAEHPVSIRGKFWKAVEQSYFKKQSSKL